MKELQEVADKTVRLGIIGCGDVAFRNYLPGLAGMADGARVVACCDLRSENAERAAAHCRPEARTYTDYREAFARSDLDAIANLTPASLHYEVNAAALDAGLHVYTEKPLAGNLEEARALIESARERGLLLMCAPAVMATSRFRWLREVLASERLGRPTLATAQMANMGPAAWRVYTGDPTVFYGIAVGPVRDQGVYLLHGITGLLGPARRVQAMGGVSIPRRTVLDGHMTGHAFDIAANDHVLIQLDLGNDTFAQLTSSYAVAGSKTPAMELHCTEGSINLGDMGNFMNANAPVDVFVRDGSRLGLEGWIKGVAPTTRRSVTNDLIALGPVHFVSCLRGEEKPLLTAEHARHVLEIMVKADESIREGCAIELGTRF